MEYSLTQFSAHVQNTWQSLNPYFNGILSDRPHTAKNIMTTCLNPYFNGILSDATSVSANAQVYKS